MNKFRLELLGIQSDNYGRACAVFCYIRDFNCCELVEEVILDYQGNFERIARHLLDKQSRYSVQMKQNLLNIHQCESNIDLDAIYDEMEKLVGSHYLKNYFLSDKSCVNRR